MNRTVWTWPLVLGALTLVGLLAALLGDGAWDAVSWLALGAPVAAALGFALQGRRPGS